VAGDHTIAPILAFLFAGVVIGNEEIITPNENSRKWLWDLRFSNFEAEVIDKYHRCHSDRISVIIVLV